MSDPSDALARLKTALAGRYDIERELGRGGMATVYLAEDLKHHRKVAVKVLLAELAATVGTERFLQEIAVIAKLHHPHILALIDSGDAAGLPYYVMPHVTGESLHDRLERVTQLPVDEAIRIAEQVACALDYTHRHNVIHRDIKPANILLHEGIALLADFGIAVALTTAGGERLTQTGFSVGTPEYLSPEQSLGEPVDARTDVYALGCVLYEMLTGEPPYAAKTPTALIAKRLKDPVPSARRLRETIPESVNAALIRALALTAADRFASAGAFAEALTAEDTSLPAARSSVVVLPFKNLSPDPENEYFSDGLTEEIIATLTRVENLRVVPRSSAMKYKDASLSVQEVARELEVGTVVEGSVRKAGDRVRIVAQAVDACSDRHLWSETYDRQLEDIFEIQSDLAARVCEALRAELSAPEQASLSRPGTTDVAAYDLYLKGRFLWNQRTESALRSSIEYFAQAIEHDSSFALAHAGLADSYAILGVYGVDRPGGVMVASKAAATAALSLDPTLARALTAQACVRAVHDWDWKAAEADFQDAMRHDPEYATAHQWYANNLLIPLRRFDEARHELERASRLEPLSSAIAASWGMLAYYERDHDRALTEYEAARSLHPHFGPIHYFIGRCQAAQARYEEALPALERAVELSSESSETLAALGHCLAVSGDSGQATEVLRRLEDWSGKSYVSPVLMAQILVGLGKSGAALDRLAEAAELRSCDLIWLGVCPVFDPLRNEPRFAELVERVGLV